MKPHPPTNVKATSRSSGALTVTWKPPNLPVGGLQCQFQYHSTSAFRAKPDWKVSRQHPPMFVVLLSAQMQHNRAIIHSSNPVTTDSTVTLKGHHCRSRRRCRSRGRRWRSRTRAPRLWCRCAASTSAALATGASGAKRWSPRLRTAAVRLISPQKPK